MLIEVIYKSPVGMAVTLCRAGQQYLGSPIDRDVLVGLCIVFSAEAAELAFLQLQQISARKGGRRCTRHIPGLRALVPVVGHPPSQTAQAAITMPLVPSQLNLCPDVTQRKVHQRMQTSQHVEAQIQDL